MAYTNVWTTAAPLDTQAANQGAVDFRATKLDVMQRIASFGAGLLAARPTPEATSGTADWTGVMYWSTDTNQAFRWNGSSWDDISSNLPIVSGSVQRYSNIVPNTITDTGSGAVGMTVTLPANALAISGLFQIFGRVFIPSFSTTPPATTPMSRISIFIGGVVIVQYPLDDLAPGIFNTDQYLNFVVNGICTGASSQLGYGYVTLGLQTNPGTGQTYASSFNANNVISSTMDIIMQIGSEESTGNSVTFQNLGVLIFN